MNSGILSLFIFLPAPLKIVVMIGGFFTFAGMNVREVAPQGNAQNRAEARALVAPIPPVAAPKIVKAAPVLLVTINSDGSFNVGDDKLTDVQLQKKIKALVTVQPALKVVIKSDALTPHQMVASGMKLCKKAGAKNVVFASKASKP